jgi:insertion element IS1016 transposase
MVISHHLVLAADEIFDGTVNWMKATLADTAKADGGRWAVGKIVVFGILKR